MLSHLRKLPALLSIYDALLLSKDIRETLIKALQDPKKYEAFFAEERMREDLTSQKSSVITFSDDDMLLGTSEHNLLTLKTLRALALDVQYLDKSKVFLQGFNDRSCWTG